MEQSKLDRLSKYTQKIRAGGTLTEAEKADREALRAEYIAEFRAQFTGILENTVIQRPDGTREKLKKEEKFALPFTAVTSSADETEEIGKKLAEYLLSCESLPKMIALYGDLGVGKTAFTRGFTSYISPKSAVRSPTFTIVNEYLGGKTPVFHFDMYRITSDDDLYSTGFYDYPDRGGFMLIEWSERIEYALNCPKITVTITKNNPENVNSRQIEIINGGK